MLDLILRHCNLPDGRTGIDIGIADGRIAAVEPALAAGAAEEIDAAGRTIRPGGIDDHIHLEQRLPDGAEICDDFFTGSRSAVVAQLELDLFDRPISQKSE